MWRKLPGFRAGKKAQNPVTSVAVMFFWSRTTAIRLTFALLGAEVLAIPGNRAIHDSVPLRQAPPRTAHPVQRRDTSGDFSSI